MEYSEAITLTERFLQELESCRYITSEQLYADRKAAQGEQQFPKLEDILEEKIRILVLRDWLRGETAGGPTRTRRFMEAPVTLFWGLVHCEWPTSKAF